MKSTRPHSFFASEPPKKKQKTDNTDVTISDLPDLPNEMWLEILATFNKKQLREMAQTNRSFYQLIEGNRLIDKAPWPEIDYTKPLRKKFSSCTFNKANKNNLQYYDTNKKGNVLVGLMNGSIQVLATGQSTWHELGKHERDTASKSLRRSSVNSVTLLSSGLIASIGEDGLRLWNKKNREQIQWLQVDGRRWNTSLWHINELSNGDLITESLNSHFYLWKKTHSSEQPYQFAGRVFIAPRQTPSNDDFDWYSTKHHIVGKDHHFIARWNLNDNYAMEKVALTELTQRFHTGIHHLMQDNEFIAHCFPNQWVVNQFNELATISHDQIKYKFLFSRSFEDYLQVTAHKFRFLLKPFDSNTPLVYINYDQEFYFSDHHVIVKRAVAEGIGIFAGWDADNNKFKTSRVFEANNCVVLIQSSELVLIRPNKGTPYVYDVATNQTLYKIHFKNKPWHTFHLLNLEKLPNGDLLGKEPETNKVRIWDGKTGSLKHKFFDNLSGIYPLENGDLVSLQDGNLDDSDDEDESLRIDVRRFGVK